MKVKKPKEYAVRCRRCLSEVRLTLDEFLQLKAPIIVCPVCNARIKVTSDFGFPLEDVKPYMEGGFSTVTEIVGFSTHTEVYKNAIREDK